MAGEVLSEGDLTRNERFFCISGSFVYLKLLWAWICPKVGSEPSPQPQTGDGERHEARTAAS